jgi:hypothetical protein
MNHTPECDFFAAPVEQTGTDAGAGVVKMPLRYWRADRFLAIFPADAGRIRAILPSLKLHPLLLAPCGAGSHGLQLSRDVAGPLRRDRHRTAGHRVPV